LPSLWRWLYEPQSASTKKSAKVDSPRDKPGKSFARAVISGDVLYPEFLLVFIRFYFTRVRVDEQLMLEPFGNRYRSFKQKVGAVIPKL
jgi:hypothetical protein